MQAMLSTAILSHVPYADGITYKPQHAKGLLTWWKVNVNGYAFHMRVTHDEHGNPTECRVWRTDMSRNVKAQTLASQTDAESAMYRYAMCKDNATVTRIRATRFADDGTHDEFTKIAWRDMDIPTLSKVVEGVTGKRAQGEKVRARMLIANNVIY